ncbi:nucleoside-diphosphate kinase [Streptomyces sp. HPF1205]|uniref:nucleoside-diphosphate kinase n=1 Tax=Streptomyces sp. HPF1205 TaxID=2873262 RepID=UPI001CEC528E|nr:nucleoside-diphosphate kinase [Streptomyces sp. HPF1205]
MNGKPRQSGAVVDGVDWERWSVILCKPDAVDRGLVDDVLGRLAAPSVEIIARMTVKVQPWQIHVHYWDLLVDRDWFPGRDIPACLDAEYAGRTVVVALAYGRRGVHSWMRDQLGHFDPTVAAAGTIRGDLGEDSLTRAIAEQRLVRNLVHTSDHPAAACRDFGIWFGAGRRALLIPHQRAATT